MVRPLVLLFQEFAEQSVNPTTPDLNSIMVGPAYHLQDYPDDKAALEVTPYGTLHADNPFTPPVANIPALLLAGPPNAPPGSWVVPNSVRIYFDEARVILASGTDGVTVQTAPNENTLSSASAAFLTQGVQAGDTLIVESPSGQRTPNLILTVLSVDSETVLRVASNFTAAATDLAFRIERKLYNQQVPSAYVETSPYGQSNEIRILGGVRFLVGTALRTVSFARVYVSYRALRTDLQYIDSVRSTREIETKIGRIDSRNPLAVGLFVARQNAGAAPIYFYGVGSDDLVGFNRARDALSVDDSLYAIVPLTSNLPVIASFKTENDNLADPSAAIDQGVAQKFRVVIGSGSLTSTETVVEDNNDARSEAQTGAVPPGTRTLEIASLGALTNKLRPGDKIQLSASSNAVSLDGYYTVSHINSETVVEVDEHIPVVVTAPEGINYTVTRPSTSATIRALVDNRARRAQNGVTYFSRIAGTGGRTRTVELVQDATTAEAIQKIEEVAGVSTTVHGDFDSGAITAQQVADALRGVGAVQSFAGSVNVTVQVDDADTAQTPLAAFSLDEGDTAMDDLVRTGPLDEVYVRLYDANAGFLTAGVLPGDILEIPADPVAGFQNGTNHIKRYIVDQVMSEQRLQIANMSGGAYRNNSSTNEYELPHTDNRTGKGQAVTQGQIHYRVLRNLSKDQQIEKLVSVSQSFNSRRAILTWPDRVVVSGLVDNSKPKNPDGTAAAADPQPGYYLSAVLGGMTAGLPSHQGFSRLGIAGIDRLIHATDYFSERQLTELSDGGWYVFAQSSPTSLPYSLHQLTTDPSTLNSGEYSIVKNFDFISLFLLDVLDPFLGVWNINNDTLGFIRQAMNTGIEQLKLRRVAKIGAPINDATLTSVVQSIASADRVEVYAEVQLPKPLNVIGLHLVA